ncbi:hypothetical protein BJ875DRAFT_166020 [Amylocarpus encephaloides]|uniref:LDB19 N-terminal domain-containing protein n=1 Tax=Amylocarpus encephaloides TaxID=45428 RepID=A0A9P8C1B3_9HELO|nr:hypothetical protein BJ875DRAFT_166020 [Amylocarpus encephaloides]
MPHKVITPFAFFRSHSNDLQESKKSVRRLSNSKSTRPAVSKSSSSASTYSLPLDARGNKMPESHKRLSLTSLMHSPKSSARSIPQCLQASLEASIESPPLVFYGPASSSTGALLSGLLNLTIHEDFMPIESFSMKLALEVSRKKPFHTHCQECSHRSKELFTWRFLQGPATLKKGTHSFPFSFLLPGHLPASMKGSLSTIDYVLQSTMVPKTGESLKLAKTLTVKRAIAPSDTPRQSIRIFPPTNLTANFELPPVVHPIGETMVSMRMDGVVKRNVDAKTQMQWKLKRITWRLEEVQKDISPACNKHAAKAGATEGEKRGTAHQDTRTIGSDEIKTGWKADFSTPDGSIELEFPFSIRPDAHSICDTKAEDGTEVSHVLVVEMIVAQELAPIMKPSQATPTGAARVLRMHFNITVTERAGMGISWDEEQPPLYENVPASPPAYGNSEIYDGEPIPDYEDLTPLDSVVEDTPPSTSGSNTSTLMDVIHSTNDH